MEFSVRSRIFQKRPQHPNGKTATRMLHPSPQSEACTWGPKEQRRGEIGTRRWQLPRMGVGNVPLGEGCHCTGMIGKQLKILENIENFGKSRFGDFLGAF